MALENLPSGIKVSGQGPAIVLLHSSLSSSKQWLWLVNELEQNFMVINCDFLGYGDAEDVSNPEHYSFEMEVARIHQALDILIPNQSFHLVGHSCGGAIALKLAVENPKRILSMSLYEPVAFHLLAKGTAERDEAESFANAVAGKTQHQSAEIFTNFWNQEGFFKSLPTKMQDLMAADMDKVNLDFKGLIGEQYNLNDVGSITAPCLLMHGQYSPHLSVHLASLIIGALDNVKELSFPAGHMAPVSHASLIQPAISEFIQSV